MKISVKAHPKSKISKVIQKSERAYEVWVRESPDKGKANAAIIEALAEHLKVARSRLNMTSGHTARNKIIEID